MTTEQWFVLELNPEPWAIGPVGYRRSNGKMSAYVGQNQQLNAYKEAVAEAIRDQNPQKLEGDVDVTFFFWRTRADYTTPQSRKARKNEADATNMQKATEDALQGILYDNDKDNVHVESYIVEQGSDVHPRVVIRVKASCGFDPNTIPDHVWDRIEQMEKPVQSYSNIWRGPEGNDASF